MKKAKSLKLKKKKQSPGVKPIEVILDQRVTARLKGVKRRKFFHVFNKAGELAKAYNVLLKTSPSRHESVMDAIEAEIDGKIAYMNTLAGYNAPRRKSRKTPSKSL